MKKSLFLILFVITIMSLLCVSCKRDPDPASPSKTLGLVDITNAKAYAVIPVSSSLGRSESDEKFVKITANGSVEIVTTKTTDGEEVNRIPSFVLDAENGYAIIVYNYEEAYLVRKSTGAAYVLPAVPELLPANGNYDGISEIRQSVFNDDDGNMYFLAEGRIRKLDCSDPNAITIQAITPEIYRICSSDCISVDKFGNVAFTYNDEYMDNYGAVKTAAGPILPLTDCDDSEGIFRDLEGYTVYKGQRLTVVNGALVKNDYDKVAESTWDGGNYWKYFEDRILMIEKNAPSAARSITINEVAVGGSLTTCNSYNIDCEGIFKQIKQSDDTLYILTSGGKIWKVSLDDYSKTEFLSENQYDIYKFAVTADNNVYFNALNLTNSHDVFGLIKPDGTVTILEDNLDDKVTMLERVQ